jgi:signal-transduction protein with cAMP-binding, CBS, and nucleotidyltransferase domain
VTPIVFPAGRMTYTALENADSLGGGYTPCLSRSMASHPRWPQRRH